MPSITLRVRNIIMSKMSTAYPLKEFIVSLALPYDYFGSYHVECSGKNALPISTEQNRLVVHLQGSCIYFFNSVLMQTTWS